MRHIHLTVLVLLLLFAAPVAAVTPLSDSDLRDNLEMVLGSSARLGDQDIRVEVHDRTVTLTGTVRTLADKWAARDLVAEARGVRALDNRLVVDTRGRSPEAIAHDVRRAFQDKPELNDGSVRVEIRGGTAVLSGSVQDARVRFLAARTAAGIEGVTAIEDRVESPSRPDDAIRADVQGLLAGADLHPVPGRITVSVEGGIATLRGVVYRLSSKFDAERTALGVNGVKGVLDELKVVEFGSAEDVAPPPPQPPPDDADIRP